jgi:hypothetical protein
MSKIITRLDLRAHLNLPFIDADDDQRLDACLAGAESFVLSFTGLGTDAPELPEEPTDPDETYVDPVSDFDGAAKSATRMLAAHLYQNREAAVVSATRVSVAELPLGIYELLKPLRVNFSGAALW